MKCQQLIDRIARAVGENMVLDDILHHCFKEISHEMATDHICAVKLNRVESRLERIAEYKKTPDSNYFHEHYYLLPDECEWIEKNLIHGEAINYTDDRHKKGRSIDNFFMRYGVGNVLAVPFKIDVSLIGFFVLHHKDVGYEWDEQGKHLLRIIGALVAQTIRIKDKDKQLQKEKKHLEAALDAIQDTVVTVDRQGFIQSINRSGERLTEWAIHELKNRQFFEMFRIIDKYQLRKSEDIITKILQNGRPYQMTGAPLMITRHIEEKDIECYGVPMFDENKEISGAVITMRDVTTHNQQEKKIQYLSKFDYITGLYNRGYMETILEAVDEKDEQSLGIIMGDLNGLKMTNDIFGYQCGDALLSEIGDIIKKECRVSDYACRWGGDEFLICLQEVDKTDIDIICHNIKNACEESNGDLTRQSISLGYAIKDVNDDSLHHTIKRAEDYMYQKKLLESRSLRSSIILSMKQTLYEKSHETEEHCDRIKHHSVRIGEHLRLSQERLDELELIATLHDIGKIVIPDEILAKPGLLNDEEWIEMKRHPEIGYRILQSVPELVHIAKYVLSHHERWDGKGYPEGLKSEEIPLLSRIISVVDAYDAMTNDRSYRRGLSKEEAMEELKTNAGSQFDPEIVELFINNVLDN
jgi:diguanylate cyclase (GGDEF)-like protein/PAS domain S-box-containing protein